MSSPPVSSRRVLDRLLRSSRLRVGALVVGAFVAGLYIGGASPGESEPRPSPYGRLNTLSRVLSYIERSYVEPVDEGRLIDAATKGMVSSLDPWSVFLTPEEYKALKEETDGEFVGVGLELAMREGQVRVIAPIEGAPAATAGVAAGDMVLEIDGKPVRELTLQEVVRLLKGPKRSKVAVTLARVEGARPDQRLELGKAKTWTVSMKRDTIEVVAVSWRLLGDATAWVRIRSFQEEVGADVERALRDAEAKAGKPLEGVVLDLRNNPGGLLLEAVRVVDLFVREGRIVSTRGRGEGTEESWDARASLTRYEGPLVLLVNRGSASASEIVAAALRDQQRATLVGDRTYGKGSVQSIIDIKDGSGLKLTVARYYGPSGASIQDVGVPVDIAVEGQRAPVVGEGVGAASGPWYASDPPLARAVELLPKAPRARPAAR